MKTRRTRFLAPRKRLAAVLGTTFAAAQIVAVHPVQATATADQTGASQASKRAWIGAEVIWFGALRELAVLDERRYLARSRPLNWGPADQDPRYYLVPGQKLNLSMIWVATHGDKASKQRYSWEADCFEPKRYRKKSAWTWTKVPAFPKSGSINDFIPVKSVRGAFDPGHCTEGNIWMNFDEGDPAYGRALMFRFTTGKKRTTPKTMKVWKWVTKSQASTVKRTGKYPMPKGTDVGQFFFFSRDYAKKVAGQFKGHTLVSGTLAGSDLMQYFTENEKKDTGPVGAFFDKSLSQPKKTFKVVK